MTLLDSLRSTIPATITPQAGPLLVTLSGGADSVCLLLALRQLGYTVEALHCNFELRGVASDGDEAFCRKLCRAHGIDLTVRHFRTRSYARRQGVSIEMAARDLRYGWFAEEASRRGAQAVCVAHHRDDSIETMLMNLVRGTGIHGLTGLKVCSQSSAYGEPFVLLRPLLGVARKDIEEWLEQQGQTWVTDATNLDADAALRNKIRLELLPLMEEMNPRVRENLAETAQRLAEAEALFNDAVSAEWSRVQRSEEELSVTALKTATATGTVLHELLHPRGFTTQQVREIHEGLDGESGRLWESREGWRLLRDRGRLLMESPDSQTSSLSSGQVLPLEGLFEGFGLRLLVRRQAIESATFVIPKERQTACFDLEKLTLPLTIRRAEEGDRIQPFGMTGTRLVSDLLTDLKLSLFEKERQPVILSGDRIAWVVGQRAAAGFEVDKQTRHVMTITCL